MSLLCSPRWGRQKDNLCANDLLQSSSTPLHLDAEAIRNDGGVEPRLQQIRLWPGFPVRRPSPTEEAAERPRQAGRSLVGSSGTDPYRLSRGGGGDARRIGVL